MSIRGLKPLLGVEYAYRDGVLHAEGVPVPVLADRYGTPLYVYSRGHLLGQHRRLAEALAPLNPTLFFAVKSNTCGAVIATLAGAGAGADVVSGGELFRALRAGISADRIAFAGVGKTEPEIEYALRKGILYFTVESEPEIERISACAERLGLVGRVAIRVNPDVDPKTHKYTSTGKKENKFGVDLERARKAYELAARLPGIEITGLHMHLGSPIMTRDPYVQAIEKVGPLVDELKAAYPTFRHLDVGGGMGISYRPDQAPFDLEAFAEAIIPPLQATGLKIGFEPGRFITGNAGILVTRVQYVKENPFKKFLVVDAAMTELIRPALYQAHHEIVAVEGTAETVLGDVVGPVCESGDFLAQDRDDLPAVPAGGLLAVLSAGAYAAAMASTYNSRPLAAEVMVDGDRHELVRKRQTVEDLVRDEVLPNWG